MVENKTRLHTILPPRGAGVRFLEVVVTLAIREFEHGRPKLTSRERRKINSSTYAKVSDITERHSRSNTKAYQLAKF